MWRRFLAFIGKRERYRPMAGRGGEWIEARYPGDPNCEPFDVLYQRMTWVERKAIARLETTAIMDGSHAAEKLAQEVEPEIVAGRVQMHDADGNWCQANPDDIAELGGQSGGAYLWLKHLVLAAYYRELTEGDRAKKVLRRCASTRSALTSLLDHAEIA